MGTRKVNLNQRSSSLEPNDLSSHRCQILLVQILDMHCMSCDVCPLGFILVRKTGSSKQVSRADLLSSVGFTLNQNCASAAWPFGCMSTHLWRKALTNKRTHSELSSVLIMSACTCPYGDCSDLSVASHSLLQLEEYAY